MLVLAGSAFAAGVEDWVSFIRLGVNSDGSETFHIDSSAFTRYSWDDLPQEYSRYGIRESNHSTWEAAEQYLGVDMPMSRTLEEQGCQEAFRVYPSDSDSFETYNCRVVMTGRRIMIDAAYRMEQWYSCDVTAFILTDKAEPDYYPMQIVRGVDVGSTIFEKYVTPSGLETGITSTQNAYWAAFMRDGIGYYVWVSWDNTPIDDNPESQARGMELLKQILDGFEI